MGRGSEPYIVYNNPLIPVIVRDLGFCHDITEAEALK